MAFHSYATLNKQTLEEWGPLCIKFQEQMTSLYFLFCIYYLNYWIISELDRHIFYKGSERYPAYPREVASQIHSQRSYIQFLIFLKNVLLKVYSIDASVYLIFPSFLWYGEWWYASGLLQLLEKNPIHLFRLIITVESFFSHSILYILIILYRAFFLMINIVLVTTIMCQ